MLPRPRTVRWLHSLLKSTERSVADYRGIVACRNYPLVYGNVPKAACTTIKNLLYLIDTGHPYPSPLWINADKKALLHVFGEDKAAFHRALKNRHVAFTFVRDPFKRAYSAFNEKIFHVSERSLPKIRHILERDYGARFPVDIDGYTAGEHARNFRAFLRFVRQNLAGKTHAKANAHWGRQVRILNRHSHALQFDFIGRVERFAEDMPEVLRRAGIPDVDISVRHNEGPPPPFPYEEILTKPVKRLLARVYEEDAQRFGYKLP